MTMNSTTKLSKYQLLHSHIEIMKV